MSWELPQEIGERLRLLLKQPRVSPAQQAEAALIEARGSARAQHLERAEIEALLPHRGQALLLDRAALLAAHGVIVARHRLEHSAALLAGHFPGQPVWPAVQQIEAIGQAGLLLSRLTRESRGPVRLVAVLAARFVAPVTPPDPVEVQAELVEDGLFCSVVGQCLQAGAVRSVAALRLLVEEE